MATDSNLRNLHSNGNFMKNYDSEVLYEMYKKKCEKLDEAIAIIKELGECGISGRRERDFLKSVGVETEPKEVKFPIPRDNDVKPPKKATITESEFDEYVGFIYNWYPSQQKELGKLKKRIFG
jgi:hypothetical protein